MRQIEEAKELNALNDVRVSVLGKKGELTAVLKGMKDVKPEDRPMVGQLVNETREAIERTLEETKKKLESAELEHRLEKRSDRRNITVKTEFCRTSSSEYDRIRRSGAHLRGHGLRGGRRTGNRAGLLQL